MRGRPETFFGGVGSSPSPFLFLNGGGLMMVIMPGLVVTRFQPSLGGGDGSRFVVVALGSHLYAKLTQPALHPGVSHTVPLGYNAKAVASFVFSLHRHRLIVSFSCVHVFIIAHLYLRVRG